MKSIFSISIACILLVNISSCTQENGNEVETELLIHFDNFVEEATAHGKYISINDLNISGYIENIEQRGTLGQCKSYSNGSKQIVIDQPYWDMASEMEREYLVFHELGHCLLGRDHRDTKDVDGKCMSIMQSGGGGCVSDYNAATRSKLMDELFE